MKNTVKILSLLLCLCAFAALLSACSISIQTRPSASEDEKPLIVCTIFPQYDFIKNIVADTMTLELLVPAGSDTHNFGVKDVTPSRLERIHAATLIVSVGGETDKKLMDELKTALSGSAAKYLTLLDLVSEKLTEEETMGMHLEGEAGGEEDCEEEEEEIDEHVWTSPKRAIEIVSGLTEELCRLNAEEEKTYRANAGAYIEKLKALDRKLEEVSAKKTVDTLIFADRFPFRYLCYDYKISADAAFQGCSTSIEPSITTLEYLYGKAIELRLPAILYMEGSNPQYAMQLAERIGGKALLLHSCHIVSAEEFKTDDYLSLMERNVEVLKTALGVKE